MRRLTLRRLLGCSSLLALSLGAFQTSEPIAAAAGDPAAPPAWCKQVQGGPASTDTPLLALSKMHAAVRLFGVGSSFQATDQALAKAMARPFVGDDHFLRDYVAAIGDGEECVAHTSSSTLGPASVELAGDLAVVHPGTGTISLPAGAKAVAIDLRGLPSTLPDFVDALFGNVPHDPVRDALDAAVALALAEPVSRPLANARTHAGLLDGDVEEPQSPYIFNDFIVPWQLEPFPAGSQVDLPLALLTGKTLSPAAAEMAAALRLAGRAWVLGDDVQVRVAESAWVPLAGEGMVLRHLYMTDPVSGDPWPDVVPADAHGDPESLVHALASLGAPPTASPGAANRPPIALLADPSVPQPDTLGPGEARAGLVSIHGMARYFYGDFAESGDFIDPRLAETIAAVDLLSIPGGPIDRSAYFAILRRFGEALHDGHNFTFDESRPFTGFLPLKIEQINGEPVVRRSEIPGIDPGDAIVGIDGIPASAWYAAEVPLTSAATDRYRFNLVTRKVLLRVYGPRTLELRSPGGSFHQVVAQPKPYAYELTFGSSPVARPSGWLAPEGAPDIYYLNMSYELTPDENAALAAIAEAQGATAMIVDMRGYPHGDHYLVDSALMPAGFDVPDFLAPLALAPGEDVRFDEGTFVPFGPGVPPSYTGPMILLVGTDTVSAAENFADMLVDNGRPLHIVGRQSAGTNGDITGLEVLGHYSVSFTGDDMRHTDGSQFVGIGIIPDIPVTLTQANVSAGNDPELSAALTALGR